MSTLTPITLISVCRPHSHILGSWVGGALLFPSLFGPNSW